MCVLLRNIPHKVDAVDTGSVIRKPSPVDHKVSYNVVPEVVHVLNAPPLIRRLNSCSSCDKILVKQSVSRKQCPLDLSSNTINHLF